MSQSFMKFLRKRNQEFINLFSSESALGLVDLIRGGYKEKDKKKHCVLISFDPPLNSPPTVFNWGDKDVWYLKNPSLDNDFYSTLDEHIEKSENSYVIILERDGLAHKRKISRFIKNYKEQRFRNRSLDTLPVFVLAEYKAPLRQVRLTELGGFNDTLLS